MIKITTDSTCDLPAQLLEQHHISVIPLGIVKGGELFRDGENITTADIAAHVDAGGDITTTNAVSIGDYEALFARESARNDAVIHLNIGIGFSCCHQNACLAAEEFDNVHVVDTANLLVGHGLLVLLARRRRRAGASVERILAMLAEKIPQVEMSFVLDRLDYMKKGGRCSAVLALGANLLKLHPCIEVQNGKMGVTKKFRGSIEKVVADYLRDRAPPAGRTSITAAASWWIPPFPTIWAAIGRKVLAEVGGFDEVIETKAGCTIFCHCGTNTLCVVFLRK